MKRLPVGEPREGWRIPEQERPATGNRALHGFAFGVAESGGPRPGFPARLPACDRPAPPVVGRAPAAAGRGLPGTNAQGTGTKPPRGRERWLAAFRAVRPCSRPTRPSRGSADRGCRFRSGYAQRSTPEGLCSRRREIDSRNPDRGRSIIIFAANAIIAKLRERCSIGQSGPADRTTRPTSPSSGNGSGFSLAPSNHRWGPSADPSTEVRAATSHAG